MNWKVVFLLTILLSAGLVLGLHQQPAHAALDNFNVQLDPSGKSLQIEGMNAQVNDFFDRYKKLITIAAGFATLTMALLFIKNLVALGASSGNAQARREAITGLLITGFATSGLGALTFVLAFFYNAFAS